MKKRILALQQKLDELKIDGVLITNKISHRYFTKFDNPDAILLITKQKAYALEDFRYTEIANKMLSDVFEVIDPCSKYMSCLGDIISKEKIKTLGIENYSLSLYEFEKLKKNLALCFVGIDGAIEKMREVKDEWEIAQIEAAQEITDLAFEHILKIISPSITENDVACELEYFMRKHGAEDKSFDTIAISGPNSSMPHGVPSNEKLQKGFLTMDFGAVVNGYHSDMTRTICLGKADEEMKKIYQTVLEAQLKALDFLRAGVNCKDADGVARDIIYKEYNGRFGHSLGHGVGLEIHEEPRLSPNYDKILVPGNVVTVEPGIYIPQKYGVRTEDMVVITENGVKNFTKSQKNLIEL